MNSDYAGSRKTVVPVSWLAAFYLRILSYFFSYVQVYFDCAGSRRTVVPALVCGISFVNCCINDFCVHFDSAGLHKTVLPVLVCGILPANFQIIIMMMIIVIVVIMIVINFFWDEQLLCRSGWNPVTGLCMILHWSLWVSFVKIWLTSSQRSLRDFV